MRRPFWRSLGPGLISGASDNDPTTVASLAVIGASTVYGLGWLVLLIIPMLAIVQLIGARIGAISKRGLETDSRKAFGSVVAVVLLTAILASNLITLIADLEGGGAALHVLTGVDYRWWILPVAAFAVGTLIFGSYERIKRVLLVLPLMFLAYPVSAILAHPDWHAVLGSLVPHVERSQDYASGGIALLGTTLTSYAYVWQTIETAKERPPLRRLGLVQADAIVGTIMAGLTFWAILIATGATLGVHHLSVNTAEEAAQALQPLAGRYAGLLFGLGLLGSALIAVPVLIATSAYVIGEMFGWRPSLDSKWWRAKKFYFTMIIVAGVAAIAAFGGIGPIKLLFLASIVGGIATPVSLSIMLLIGRNAAVMGKHILAPGLALAGWAVVAIVTAAAGAYLLSTIWLSAV